MIELPESIVLAEQLNKELVGKQILSAFADTSHHGFAWYYEDPKEYGKRLEAKQFKIAKGLGSMVEIWFEDIIVLLTDGVRLTFIPKSTRIPPKHQLLILFTDGTALVASVQMYGGLWCFKEGALHNPYYEKTKAHPTPYDSAFNLEYFYNLINAPKVQTLSLKAFLATEQRISGLGNGVLQDILWDAGMHPKIKVKSLSIKEKEILFHSVVNRLTLMRDQGGRDTEHFIHGDFGGYQTVLSKNTVGSSCPRCQTKISKEAYLGGSIYYCPHCQSESREAK